jgi:hypothetical protein
MTRRFASTALHALLFACCTTPTFAGLLYTPLDHPLAAPGGTTPYAIDGDRVVGGYLDAAGAAHGFVYQAGSWSTLDHPDALAGGTTAYGVSPALVSGSYVAPSGQVLGFLYNGTKWVTLARPPTGGAGGDTFARGVSDGTVVGYSIESAVARGFIYSGGTFTDIAQPVAVSTFPMDVDAGRVVGNYDDLLGSHGFVFDSMTWLTLDYPLGGLLGTSVTGVDGPNVVGFFNALPDGAAHGFLYDGAEFTPIDIPGATDTTVYGIDGDRVVGTYVEASGEKHGFVATVPEPCAAGFLLLLPTAVVGRPRRRTVPR